MEWSADANTTSSELGLITAFQHVELRARCVQSLAVGTQADRGHSQLLPFSHKLVLESALCLIYGFSGSFCPACSTSKGHKEPMEQAESGRSSPVQLRFTESQARLVEGQVLQFCPLGRAAAQRIQLKSGCCVLPLFSSTHSCIASIGTNWTNLLGGPRPGLQLTITLPCSLEGIGLSEEALTMAAALSRSARGD